MSEPKRIQRRRTKGWRMPKGAIYVGRPSRWGNPFVVMADRNKVGRLLAYNAFNRWIHPEVTEYFTIDVAPLRGHDLACWCSLDQPCHADVLLELANR